MDSTTSDFLDVSASEASSPAKTDMSSFDTSRYHSALDTLTDYASFDAETNNHSKADSLNSLNENISGGSIISPDKTLHASEASEFNIIHSPKKNKDILSKASASFIKSESSETNTSMEEVDPKSLLANKTIFKTDNPDLSIIEINRSSSKENEDESLVQLVDPPFSENRSRSIEQLVTKPQVTVAQPEIVGTPINKTSASKKQQPGETAENLLNSKLQQVEDNLAVALGNDLPSSNVNASNQFAAPLAKFQTQEGNVEQVQKETGQDDSNNEENAIENASEKQTDNKRQIIIYDTLEEFEQNLPDTVTVLQTPFGSKVYLVGTAHFSEESQNDVSFVIRNVRPDVVMVELCHARINILKLDEKTLLEEAKSFNYAKLRSIIRTNGYINGVFFILLLQMSAQVAKDLGMAPGGEFRRAFDEVQRLPNCTLALGDRPIRITLQRALHALSFWQTMKLVWRIGFNDTISIEEVEECKQSDLMEKLLKELAGEFPAFSEVFVKERDMYLCHSLQLASLPKVSLEDPNIQRPVRVVGVVGIGHAQGIAKNWGRVDPDWIPAILKIPEPSKKSRFIKFAIKYGLISLAMYGAFRFLRPRLQRLT